MTLIARPPRLGAAVHRDHHRAAAALARPRGPHPRYLLVGCALIAGPAILAATMSGPALAVTTGLAAGALLLGNAAAGFHDLAGLRRARQLGPAQRHVKTR